MTQRITDLDDPAWMALFTGVRASWFRLETLQVYDVAYEEAEYRDFLATGRLDREPGAWQQMISNHTRAGRRLQRVHVVREPLTDYLRYELAAYAHNGRAGEDIRIIPTTLDDWPSAIPEEYDFWLFDDTKVWEMVYDDCGRFSAARLVTEDDGVAECRRWRDTAIAQSIPLADYRVHAA